MDSNPFKGGAYLLEGLKLIFRKGIRKYVLIPLIINIALFSALIWFGAAQFNVILDWLLPGWLD
ncbi:MAG TPA: EI24 domain-containing protein, partial [Nitrospiria bacterium]